LGRNLVHAVRTGAPTVCSATDGRWVVEMRAVYRADPSGGRVELPLCWIAAIRRERYCHRAQEGVPVDPARATG